MERPSLSDLLDFVETELAKARECPNVEKAAEDIVKWEDLLEGLRILQERRGPQ